MQGLKNFRNLLQGPTLQQSLLLQGLHSSSSGQAPENDAAKDMVDADDDASGAARRPIPAIGVNGLRSGRTPRRVRRLLPRALLLGLYGLPPAEAATAAAAAAWPASARRPPAAAAAAAWSAAQSGRRRCMAAAPSAKGC